jgi:hypothetical protein
MLTVVTNEGGFHFPLAGCDRANHDSSNASSPSMQTVLQPPLQRHVAMWPRLRQWIQAEMMCSRNTHEPLSLDHGDKGNIVTDGSATRWKECRSLNDYIETCCLYINLNHSPPNCFMRKRSWPYLNHWVFELPFSVAAALSLYLNNREIRTCTYLQ